MSDSTEPGAFQATERGRNDGQEGAVSITSSFLNHCSFMSQQMPIDLAQQQSNIYDDEWIPSAGYRAAYAAANPTFAFFNQIGSNRQPPLMFGEAVTARDQEDSQRLVQHLSKQEKDLNRLSD